MLENVLFASGNAGKFWEAERVARQVGITLINPRDIGDIPRVAETGTTYEENARIKAIAFTAWSGLPSISDDAGLEVEALGGKPGVFTADFAPTGEERIQKMLKALEGGINRRAKFVSVCVFRTPEGSEIVGRGEVRGMITSKRGEMREGVELASIFVPDGEDRVMAALSEFRTHRVRALEAVFTSLSR